MILYVTAGVLLALGCLGILAGNGKRDFHVYFAGNAVASRAASVAALFWLLSMYFGRSPAQPMPFWIEPALLALMFLIPSRMPDGMLREFRRSWMRKRYEEDIEKRMAEDDGKSTTSSSPSPK